MSKVDAQRAMREARYARDRARGAVAAPAPASPALRAPRAEPVTVAAPPGGPPAEGDRCGHTSMNGRACTRAAGHPEKSHRYS